MRKITVLLLLFLGLNIYSGDVAIFTNLGFSPDGKYFLFGEHGVLKNNSPYANMWIVDVPRNDFVKGGVFSGKYNISIQPGESSLGALLKLVDSSNSIIKKYKIDYLDLGRPLYIKINEETESGILNFRDFVTGKSYMVKLDQSLSESGEVSSSFSIELEITNADGQLNKYKVGNPHINRKNVKNYAIERIIENNSGKNIVFVLAKNQIIDGETQIRYMVETIQLK